MPVTEMKIPHRDNDPFEEKPPVRKRSVPRDESPKRDLRTNEGKKAQAKEEAKSEKLATRTEACRSAIGLFIQTPLVLLGRTKVEFQLDAQAIEAYKGPIAASVAEIADAIPVVGTFLDNIEAVGPFGNLLNALLPLAAQVAENHSKLPAQLRDSLGVAPKEMLLEEIQRREAEAQAATQAMSQQQSNGSERDESYVGA